MGNYLASDPARGGYEKKRKIWGFWHVHTAVEVAAWQGTDTSQTADERRGEDV